MDEQAQIRLELKIATLERCLRDAEELAILLGAQRCDDCGTLGLKEEMEEDWLYGRRCCVPCATAAEREASCEAYIADCYRRR